MSLIQKLKEKQTAIKESILEQIVKTNEHPVKQKVFVALASFYLGNKREEELKAISKRVKIPAEQFVLWNYLLYGNIALLQDLTISYETYKLVKDQPLPIQGALLAPALMKTIGSYGWDLYRVSVRKKKIYPPLGYMTLIANAHYLLRQYNYYGEKIGEKLNEKLFSFYVLWKTTINRKKDYWLASKRIFNATASPIIFMIEKYLRNKAP